MSPGDVALAHGPARPDPSPPSAQTPRTAPCDAFPRRYVDPRVHGYPPPFPARRLESRWASDPGADGQREVSRAQGGKISPSIMLPPGSYHPFHLFDPSCPTPPPACKSSCPACVTFGVCSSPRSHSAGVSARQECTRWRRLGGWTRPQMAWPSVRLSRGTGGRRCCQEAPSLSSLSPSLAV